jgi:hypothetical protein
MRRLLECHRTNKEAIECYLVIGYKKIQNEEFTGVSQDKYRGY